ncbi:MAG: hypothetical protein JHC33_15050 [Ignisphaera sp.]|nr:hypothetical protein [Ignisphaera sp.]
MKRINKYAYTVVALLLLTLLLHNILINSLISIASSNDCTTIKDVYVQSLYINGSGIIVIVSNTSSPQSTIAPRIYVVTPNNLNVDILGWHNYTDARRDLMYVVVNISIYGEDVKRELISNGLYYRPLVLNISLYNVTKSTTCDWVLKSTAVLYISSTHRELQDVKIAIEDASFTLSSIRSRIDDYIHNINTKLENANKTLFQEIQASLDKLNSTVNKLDVVMDMVKNINNVSMGINTVRNVVRESTESLNTTLQELKELVNKQRTYTMISLAISATVLAITIYILIRVIRAEREQIILGL